jgi:hypothetical protein
VSDFFDSESEGDFIPDDPGIIGTVFGTMRQLEE